MNAHWQVTVRYNGAMANVLGVFTFGDDARAFDTPATPAVRVNDTH